jgi:hypothetical protein
MNRMRTQSRNQPHRLSRALSATAALLLLAACEGSGAHVVGPAGRETFNMYVAIGTGLSMGAQSGGVLYNSQVEAWPALLAHQAGASITTPLLRAPGCTPPLIAPLQFGTFLSGASSAARDTSCAGTLGAITPPANNVGLIGATADRALNLTPKIIAATPASYDIGDRSRYPIVLGNTQSQVTAMLVESPSFVSVELGFAEVLGAATSGLVVPATAYGQPAGTYSYIPASVFSPVYAIRRQRGARGERYCGLGELQRELEPGVHGGTCAGFGGGGAVERHGANVIVRRCAGRCRLRTDRR